MIYGNYDRGYLRLPDEPDHDDTDDRSDDLRMLEREMNARDCEEEEIIRYHEKYNKKTYE